MIFFLFTQIIYFHKTTQSLFLNQLNPERGDHWCVFSLRIRLTKLTWTRQLVRARNKHSLILLLLQDIKSWTLIYQQDGYKSMGKIQGEIYWNEYLLRFVCTYLLTDHCFHAYPRHAAVKNKSSEMLDVLAQKLFLFAFCLLNHRSGFELSMKYFTAFQWNIISVKQKHLWLHSDTVGI